MRPTTPPLPADMLLGNDTIREVLSLVAAELMQQSAITATGAFDREVKQGRFRVLRGLYMPGIVVEMGFLSHPSEGRLIPLPAWQACTVEALIDPMHVLRCEGRLDL